MSKFNQIAQIYSSPWRQALAGKALNLILEKVPGAFEKYEEKIELNRRAFDSLIIALNSLGAKTNWESSMNLLVNAIVAEYLLERNTKNPRFTGEFKTMLDHADDHWINVGFTSVLFAELDHGITEAMFTLFVANRFEANNAIMTGNLEEASKRIDRLSEVMDDLNESFGDLIKKMQELAG